MGLKAWLDLSGHRRAAAAAAASKSSGTGIDAADHNSSSSNNVASGHRRHSSMPAPRVLSSSSGAAPRSSSIGTIENNDTIDRGGTAFATALQDPPGAYELFEPYDDLEQKAMCVEDLDAAPQATDANNINRSPQSRLMDSMRFSWHNVLGHSSRSDTAAPVSPTGATVATVATAKATLQHTAESNSDSDMGIVMQGWLEKCGQQFKTWNWRFFVLRTDGELTYYSDESQTKLKGRISVGYHTKAAISVQSNPMEKTNVFLIATPQRNTMIAAPSVDLMTKWIQKLQSAGALPSAPWDPLRKTVQLVVDHAECPHEWLRYDDPTSYIHMEGYLFKRGHKHKNWKNRFFRIEAGELRYYTIDTKDRKGVFPLRDTIVSPGMAQCSDGRANYFVLTTRDGTLELHLNAHSETSMHKWIEALTEAQTALRRRTGSNTKDTVSGLALVVKRSEELPLVTLDVVYVTPQDITVEMERRTEALVVTKAPRDDVPIGAQVIAVDGCSILREAYTTARQVVRDAAFPLRLTFVVPPSKTGVLIKKSRSGFANNWKQRVLVVANGHVHYYKQVGATAGADSSSRRRLASTASAGSTPTQSMLKHRKSFSLVGCYLNLVQFPNRPLCIVVARSPSDKLVLQTASERERIEWASVLYCSIRIVSQGITSGHIANLHLEPRRTDGGGDRSRMRNSSGDTSDMRADRNSAV